MCVGCFVYPVTPSDHSRSKNKKVNVLRFFVSTDKPMVQLKNDLEGLKKKDCTDYFMLTIFKFPRAIRVCVGD